MRELTTAQAIREALAEEMRRDPRVFLLGEDIGIYGGAFGVTNGLLEEFGPERVRDTPIAESAVVGCAIGASLLGMRPVVEIQFSDFITNAMDAIVNQAAKIRYMFGGKARVRSWCARRGEPGRERQPNTRKASRRGRPMSRVSRS